jgi:hypothetical protein
VQGLLDGGRGRPPYGLMVSGMDMNIPQEIFCVFYAIFWGAVFNVLARWKPFKLKQTI